MGNIHLWVLQIYKIDVVICILMNKKLVKIKKNEVALLAYCNNN